MHLLAEIYQWLESNPAARQCKLILAASVQHLQNQHDEDDPKHSQANSRVDPEKQNKDNHLTWIHK